MRLPARPEIIAHRGASAYAPEHTFAAYDLAVAQGADRLELDVRVTADGELVVVHDRTLLRTTGDPRAVAETPVKAIGALCAPTLDQVLERYATDVGWLVELKDPAPEWEHRVAAAVIAHGVADRATLQSFDLRAIERLRHGAPGLDLAALCRRPPGAARLERIARTCSAVHVPYTELTVAVVARARLRGLAIRTWTPNARRDLRRALAMGVDGVITDRPDAAVAVAERHYAPPAAA